MGQPAMIEKPFSFDPPSAMTGDGLLPRIGHPSFYRTFPQQARSRQTVAAILSTACTLSREVGAVRIEQVAHEVGLSKAALYRFFSDDHSLRIVLASQELELYLDAMTDALHTNTYALHTNTYARWQDIVLAHATVRCDEYRTRKGPALVVERYRCEANESEIVADYLLGEIRLRFADALLPSDAHYRIDIAIRLIDAIVGRAFTGQGATIDAVVEECRAIVDRFLTRPAFQRADSLAA